MVPLGLLGPLSADWFKEHKVVGCPHPHVPSGKIFFINNEKNFVYFIYKMHLITYHKIEYLLL